MAWVALMFYLPGAELLEVTVLLGAPWYWWTLGYWFYEYLLIIIVLIATVSLPIRAPVQRIVGRRPTQAQMRSSLVFTLFLFVVAWAAVYLLFYPLSYIAPDFVTYWLLDLPDMFHVEGDRFLVLPNIATLLIMCVVAPVVEEFAFRGVILHRWTHKYGLWPAILWSSLLFAVVHPDTLGAFTFGIGMCVLYLRTQSLWVPILCHSAYNLLVSVWELTLITIEGPNAEYTLTDFRSEWFYGVAAGFIAVLWVWLYFRRPRPPVTWRLPAIQSEAG